MNREKAPLVLMEQLAMLLVFALAAAVCLRLFVASDQLSRQLQDQDNAAALCQSTAEALRHNGGDIPAALSEVSGADAGQREGFGYFVSYGPDWSEFVPNGIRSASYTLRARALDSGVPGLGKAEVEAYRWQNGEMQSLFRLETAWQEVMGHGA